MSRKKVPASTTPMGTFPNGRDIRRSDFYEGGLLTEVSHAVRLVPKLLLGNGPGLGCQPSCAVCGPSRRKGRIER